MSACITSHYLAGSLSKDVLQLHDFLHQPVEIVAGRARWQVKNSGVTAFPAKAVIISDKQGTHQGRNNSLFPLIVANSG